jgi:uncharacterized protein (TIGR04255 family)
LLDDTYSKMMTHPLPEFDKPPVTEVVLGVQFEKLGSLKTPQLGYLWQAFRARFPQTEEQPPLEPVFEQFGARTGHRPGVRLELLATPPQPRLWFLNESGNELVQIQQDRFVRNWRKQEDSDEYPRYRNLRELFRRDFEEFCSLVQGEQWGEVVPNQCEVTYLNIIPAGEGWEGHGDLGKVLTVFAAHYSDDQLGRPEEASVSLQYVLRNVEAEPVGRLHIAANPVLRVSDNRAAIRLSLTARGKPEGDAVDGVMQFLDRGHEAIVRGFTSITTPEMHDVWKRNKNNES